ncbi:MAG: type II secretion system protein [Acidimicrobiales bacterium]
MIPRNAVRAARALRRARGDEGFTLVEMVVVLVAFGVLLAITVPVVSTMMQTTSQVRNTYTNMNSQLWLSTNLQRLLRAAVAPAPSFDGATATTPPRTPFLAGAITPTSLTFYANTGTVNGPEQVEASCTRTSTDTTLCAPVATFLLTMAPAELGTCPFSETTTSHTCTWSTSSARTLLSIPHVTNGDNASAEPLFTYAYGSTTVCSAGQPTGCSGSDAVTFASTNCKKSSASTSNHPFTTCPAGEIDKVSYNLSFDVKLTRSTAHKSTALVGGLQTKTTSGTYVMSSTTVLYSPAVG